ncbi:hypothetical protein MC7420_2999 [Coleofasciculus chthonoplastes PCC 7420]|uniref:Uncharacterized protein n=1 Tax=Coleofasciculus chthonoplastes PCC 7420 TaxID=118168 RepID=B4VK25_9CYAN|nr:hypothetical protein MC7420_2999 [Coleofasciculus chthonoplastes PCC 7420]
MGELREEVLTMVSQKTEGKPLSKPLSCKERGFEFLPVWAKDALSLD